METREPYLKDLMGHVMQIIYVIFLGILIAVFFGLGIDTFYPAPKPPEYPELLMSQQYKTVPSETQTEEEISAQKSYDEAQSKYTEDMKPHSRNVSIIALVLSVIALALSLTILMRWEVIANGVLLGGVFTLGYSIIQGMMTEDTRFRFVIVSVGVLVSLVLGYYKFIKPTQKK
jgi:hypothetical protein